MNNVMPETMLPTFQDKQREFTDYLRDPANKPMPDDVKQEHMVMYRDLLFNNINSFLTANFPILHVILDEQLWLTLAREFFAKHESKSPYFSEIAIEFLHFLEFEHAKDPLDPSFMLELAHYEWVEMALSIAREQAPEIDPDMTANLSTYKISLSPLAWPLIYRYPVHQISPQNQPLEAPLQCTCLVVYRDRSEQVKFTTVTTITYRLLQIIQQQGRITAHTCLKQICRENQAINRDIIIKGGLQMLNEMAEKGIIYNKE